jgi:hypothetical protein
LKGDGVQPKTLASLLLILQRPVLGDLLAFMPFLPVVALPRGGIDVPGAAPHSTAPKQKGCGDGGDDEDPQEGHATLPFEVVGESGRYVVWA